MDVHRQSFEAIHIHLSVKETGSSAGVFCFHVSLIISFADTQGS